MNAVVGPRPPSLRLSRLEAMQAFRRSPLDLFERAAALGDVVTVRLPGFSAWLLNHPDLVWHVLATRSREVKEGSDDGGGGADAGRGAAQVLPKPALTLRPDRPVRMTPEPRAT